MIVLGVNHDPKLELLTPTIATMSPTRQTRGIKRIDKNVCHNASLKWINLSTLELVGTYTRIQRSVRDYHIFMVNTV